MTRPLSFVAVGLALVALDFRVEMPDLLPDPLGWALVAWGAWRLRQQLTAGLAVLAAALSVADFALPYTYRCVDTRGEPADSEWPGCVRRHFFDPTSDLRAIVIAGSVVAGGVALWVLLGSLIERARVAADDKTVGRFRDLQVAVTAVWTVPTLLVVVAGILGGERGYDPVWNGNLEFVALAGLVVFGWLVVELVLHRDRAFAVVT